MKTFKEFLDESYEYVEEKTLKTEESEEERRARTRPGLLKRMGTGVGRLKQQERLNNLTRLAYKHLVRAGTKAKGKDVDVAADRLAKGQTTPKKESIKRRKKIINDLRSSYSEKDYEKANDKQKKLNNAELDAHHITPLHYSRKLHASMTPEQWKERVRRDAESGIYHGHHPKNLMGVVVAGTPESRSRRGIFHRTGGAHELEKHTRDLYSTAIPHKDLLAAAHRRQLRKLRERERTNNI